jgi:small subunit ribosomal protein S1
VTVENRISLEDLSPGDRLEGTVRKVTLSGAIVDVGAQVDGLLHISDLGQRGVTRTSDVLKEGEPLTAWVKRVDPGQNRLSLTLTEPPQFNWNDMKAGMQVEGKVVRLEKFGAFVAIGAPTDGLVHVSEMATGRVNKPSDVVSEGDVVSVWIKDIDRRQGRISLSMVEPAAVDIRQLRPDMVLTGKVVRLESFGAFVNIGAERDGMVHVTEMSSGYVNSPSDVVSVGDEVKVRVLEVDSRRGRISLSMKDLPGDDQGWQEDEMEELPTAMELALREAMEEQGIDLPTGKEDRRRRKPKSKRRRYEQDDIIERTLRDHRA